MTHKWNTDFASDKPGKHDWPLTLRQILDMQLERRRLVPRFKPLPAPPEASNE